MDDATNTNRDEANMNTKAAFTANAAEIETELQHIEAQPVPQQVTDAIAETRAYLAEIADQDDAWWREHGDGASQCIVVGAGQGITPLSNVAEQSLHGIQRRKGQF